MASWTEELVFIESEDGLPLEGVVIGPSAGAPGSLPVVWVHGLTGKFYGRTMVTIGRGLAARGLRFVSGNNRGHDFGAVYRQGPESEPLIAGGAWEMFDEAPRDIGAWITYATALGHERVILLGHSLGALKVAAYQAERQDQRVAGLIAASPPTRAGQLRPDLVEQASALVAAGRGRDLLPWNISPAGGGTVSAQTYLNRAEVNIDTYGFFTPEPKIAQVRCPVLALYGTNEAWVGGEADLETIRHNARSAPRVATHLIEGSDHVYTGCEAEVAAVIADWVRTIG